MSSPAVSFSATSPRYRAWGLGFAGLGAMLFACKGLFAKQLYAHGVDFVTLCAVRAAIAAPLFLAFAAWREGPARVLRTPPRAIAVAAFAGLLCYYVGALTDFYALTLIDASIERVLLFSYPSMVVLFSSIVTRTWPRARILAAVGLTYLGIFFSVGGFDGEELRSNLLGAGLVLVSALSYAIYFLLGERYTREIGSSRFTLWAMMASAVALILHWFGRHDVALLMTISAPSWGLLTGLGILCLFMPALLQAEGVKRIGAQRGAVISTLGPPTTVLLAWALLGERMTAWQLLGVVLILSGILWLELGGRTRAQPSSD